MVNFHLQKKKEQKLAHTCLSRIDGLNRKSLVKRMSAYTNTLCMRRVKLLQSHLCIQSQMLLFLLFSSFFFCAVYAAPGQCLDLLVQHLHLKWFLFANLSKANKV